MTNISINPWHGKKLQKKEKWILEKVRHSKIDGKQIAVFNQDGFHAMDDLCVHQDGSIAPGKLEGDIVECPLHFWKYNIKTGELVDYLKDIKLETYTVQSRDDGLYVDI